MLKSNLIDLYPHNKVVFDKVLENLKTHNKVGVVQATGTGKGKLAACFVEFLIYHKSNAKILIVAPLRSILENYKSNFNLEFNNIKYITYQKLNNLSDTDLEKIGKSCDLIILDEYHRCGATEWYKSIIKLFKSVDENKCKVVGLTATPIRYLDNSRDMSEELFNNNVIEGLNIEEAILDGILPGFVYNACYYGVETTLKEVRDKLENNEYRISDDTIRNDLLVKVKELNMLYHNRYKIENIIKENTKDLGKNQKWVIFCKDKENLYEIRKYCVNWFNGNPNLYIINSDKQGVDNDRTLTEFRKIKEGINVLLCVNMLNEGVHIKDLNGVIMLRKTDSPILFLQQLGRSLETGKQFQPIIFDLIGNYRGLRIEEDGVEKTPIDIVRGIEKRTKDKKNYVIVHNFTEEMHNVLNEISFYSYGVWSDNEIDILMTYYPIGGADLCLEKGLNKTRQAIVVKAYKLKLTEDSKYTDNEIEILKKYYLIGGSKLCQEKGVNRTVGSIQKMAQKLGLSENRKYTEKENNIIEKYYLIGGSKMCQEKGLNRTHQSIRSQANRLNLKMENHEYSENEKNILIKYYPLGGVELCLEKGLNRTKGSITAYANKLGLYYLGDGYTEEEISILKKYYPIGGVELCIEKGLNRSEGSIRAKANRLKLNNREMITQEEIDILKKYYPIGGYKLCQENGLNRSQASIYGMAKKYGVEKMSVSFSPEEEEILRLYFVDGGSELCQEKGLNKTKNAIQTRAYELGLFKNRFNDKEILILKEYYPIGGSKLCIEKGVNKSPNSIRRKAFELGLVGNHKYTDVENMILMQYYPIGGAELCINNGVNRTVSSIRTQANKLGIRRKRGK